MKIFGERLQQIQKDRKMSQKEMAALLEISANSMSAYMSGKRTPPLDVAERIAQKLGVSLDWLCGIGEGAVEINAEGIKIFMGKSCGNLIRIINLLLDNDVFNGFSVHKEFNRQNGVTVGEKFVSTFSCDVQPVSNYFNDCERVFDLYRSGTIDQEMYEAWVERKLKQLDREDSPICPF